MKKQYKTARGLTFDPSFFQKNQNTIAAGNLGGRKPVNAKGDILGKNGKVEKSREKIIRDYYRDAVPADVKKASELKKEKEFIRMEEERVTEFKSIKEISEELKEVKEVQKKTKSKK